MQCNDGHNGHDEHNKDNKDNKHNEHDKHILTHNENWTNEHWNILVFLHSIRVLSQVTLDEDDLTLTTSKVVANVDLCSNLIQQVIQRTIFLPLTLHSRYIDLGAKFTTDYKVLVFRFLR